MIVNFSANDRILKRDRILYQPTDKRSELVSEMSLEFPVNERVLQKYCVNLCLQSRDSITSEFCIGPAASGRGLCAIDEVIFRVTYYYSE